MSQDIAVISTHTEILLSLSCLCLEGQKKCLPLDHGPSVEPQTWGAGGRTPMRITGTR